MAFRFSRSFSIFLISLSSAQSFASTMVEPTFKIVDRAPWNMDETISRSFGTTDESGNHWIGSSLDGGASGSVWQLRTYAHDQVNGQDKLSYPSASNGKQNYVSDLAFQNHLVAAVGFSMTNAGSDAVARISYDDGTTWNDLNEYSCGIGNFTLYTSADFVNEQTIFISGFCIDLTGSAKWFVRRGLFDQAEMQWFWSNSDQLVGRIGVDNYASQVLVAASGEIFVSGHVHNERGSAALVRSSLDGGRTWKTIANPVNTPEFISVHKFIQDASGRLTLLATTGSMPLEHQASHIMTSADQGRTWTALADWSPTDGTLVGHENIFVRGDEVVHVGSITKGFTGTSYGWVRRTIDRGLTWSYDEVAGEFELGGTFTGIHQFGSSPLMISGTDRMTGGEDRITYRSFRPH